MPESFGNNNSLPTSNLQSILGQSWFVCLLTWVNLKPVWSRGKWACSTRSTERNQKTIVQRIGLRANLWLSRGNHRFYCEIWSFPAQKNWLVSGGHGAFCFVLLQEPCDCEGTIRLLVAAVAGFCRIHISQTFFKYQPAVLFRFPHAKPFGLLPFKIFFRLVMMQGMSFPSFPGVARLQKIFLSNWSVSSLSHHVFTCTVHLGIALPRYRNSWGQRNWITPGALLNPSPCDLRNSPAHTEYGISLNLRKMSFEAPNGGFLSHRATLSHPF